jgi:hypothetical protein
MEMNDYKSYSPALGRDMECKVYGHKGRPVLFIPCQDGRFYDFENFHMTDTWAPWIESGKVMVFAIDTVDQETWSDTKGDPYWRIRRYEQWLDYITDELVPFMRNMVNERISRNHGVWVQSGGYSWGESLFPPSGSVRPASCFKRSVFHGVWIWLLYGRGSVPELPDPLSGGYAGGSPIYPALQPEKGSDLCGTGSVGTAGIHQTAGSDLKGEENRCLGGLLGL